MPMRLLYTILLPLFIFTNVFGQITINRNDLPIMNDTLRITKISSVGLDVNSTGANHVWDFTDVNSQGEEVMEFKAALQTDYALFFLGLTYFGLKGEDLTLGGYGMTDVYNFFEIDNSKYGIKGIGLKALDIPVATTYSKLDKIFSLPLRFAQKDSNAYAFKMDVPSIGTYKGDGVRVTHVDGWGKITTPFGTFDCLRTYSVVQGTDSIFASVFGFDIKLGFPVHKVEYQWWAKGHKVPVLSVEGRMVSNTFVPTNAYYRGVNKIVPTAIYEHANNHFWNVLQKDDISWEIQTNETNILQQLKVYSLDGKMIKSAQIESSISNIQIDLPKGIYIFVLESEKGISSKKVLKK